MIPQEIIDQILDRLDIVEVVSGYIQLKRAGRSFKTTCPFHNEKTPSFIVSPERQIYHCFGCGTGGNAIGFVMQYENMSFVEAVTMLAARAGVELPKYKNSSGEKETLANQLYEVNKVAAAFYQNVLRKEDGKNAFFYLKKRGIDEGTLSEFRLGYAPCEWESLRKYCSTKNIPDDLLSKAGLTIPSEKGKGSYDRFRDRVIFPIFNERDHIVGFGGRVLDDSLPKYINSPETVIYSKSNVLYGLNFSKKGIRHEGYAIIVEGYMDVIVPFQEGITNVVAASGTALTPAQVALLKKHTDTVVMVFDADQAGETASLRGLDILVTNGIKVRIASLPTGEDPDSFVRKNGKEKFEQFISTAKDLFDYKLGLLVGKWGVRDIENIVNEMLPTISRVQNAVIQSDYLRRLAEHLGVHEASLRHEMGKVKPDYSYHYESAAKQGKVSYSHKASEIHLLGLAISDKKMFDRVSSELGLDKFHDNNVIKVIKLVNDFFEKGESKINPGKLLGRLEKDEAAKSAVIQAVAKADITKDPVRALEDCMFSVLKENRDTAIKELTLRLKQAQDANNDKEIREILIKISKLHKESISLTRNSVGHT